MWIPQPPMDTCAPCALCQANRRNMSLSRGFPFLPETTVARDSPRPCPRAPANPRGSRRPDCTRDTAGPAHSCRMSRRAGSRHDRDRRPSVSRCEAVFDKPRRRHPDRRPTPGTPHRSNHAGDRTVQKASAFAAPDSLASTHAFALRSTVCRLHSACPACACAARTSLVVSAHHSAYRSSRGGSQVRN